MSFHKKICIIKVSLKEVDIKKLSEKSRKILKAVYRGLWVTAIILVFHSCDSTSTESSTETGTGFVTVEELEFIIHGSVISKETREPIPGICFWIKEDIKEDTTTTYYKYVLTDNSGEFFIYWPKQDNYTIIFTDIDGNENGGVYKQHIITLTKKEAESSRETPLIIELEKVTE